MGVATFHLGTSAWNRTSALDERSHLPATCFFCRCILLISTCFIAPCQQNMIMIQSLLAAISKSGAGQLDLILEAKILHGSKPVPLPHTCHLEKRCKVGQLLCLSTSQVSTLIQLNYKSMIAEKEYMYSRLMTAYTSPLTCNTVHSCLAGVYIEHFQYQHCRLQHPYLRCSSQTGTKFRLDGAAVQLIYASFVVSPSNCNVLVIVILSVAMVFRNI